MKKLDLRAEFKKSICSFEVAKKASEAGMSCANTYYAYDENGGLNDGAWLEKVTGAKMYPAINIALAIGLLENLSIEPDLNAFSEKDNKFCFEHKGNTTEAETLADLCVLVWIKYKNK